MFKKCKVVMLPGNEKSNIQLNIIHNHLFCGNDGAEIPTQPYQHLYILSPDEEIKKGDWVINNDNNKPSGCIYKCGNITADATWCNKNKCFKVIASTDSLKIKNKNFSTSRPNIDNLTHVNLPSILQSFIDKYVNEYDKGNKIEEVMVEYEAIPNTSDNPFTNPSGNYTFEGAEWELKLNPDNTINIQSVKDSWTREEVIVLLGNCGIELLQWVRRYMKDPNTKEFMIDDFIKSNL